MGNIPAKIVENIKSYNTKEKRKILTFLETGAKLSQCGNYTEAISYYDKALQIDPDDTNVLVNKGNALTNLARYKNACGCYDKVLVKNPNSSMALYNKSCIKALHEEIDESLKLLEKAININPNLVNAAKTDGSFLHLRDVQKFKSLLGIW